MNNASDHQTTDKRQHRIMNIGFASLSRDEALVQVESMLDSTINNSVYFLNTHCVNVSCDDFHYRTALHNADLVLPDGVGIELACRLQKVPYKANLNGTDLFPHLCQLFDRKKTKVFLLGAEGTTADKVAGWMRENYQHLEVVGTHHGHFDNDEAVIEKINTSGAEVLFVAMGVPRQELWIEKHRAALATKVNFAVGGLFEFYSNNIPRAPKSLRKLKLEWGWRLLQEPKRMWKRYLIGNLVYLQRIFFASMVTNLSPQRSQADARVIPKGINFQAYIASKKQYFRNRFDTVTRRLFDLTVSSLALMVMLPFLPVVAALIKIDSKGPVFFAQKRIGAHGKTFYMYKLRSMYQDAEARLAEVMHLNEKSDGIMFKVKNDPRITPLGRILRKFSIDELPQFWNVFKGDMSIVGPRPPLHREVKQYLLPYLDRLSVKPGLTSDWVLQGRNALSFEEQAVLDIDYTFSTSVFNDIKILLKTIPVVLTGKGAS